MSLRAPLCVAALVALLAVGGGRAAQAAPICAAEMKSGEAKAKTKEDAEAAAISWWSSRAGSLGEGYQHWQQAKDKSITCRDGPAGSQKCIASAKPCLPEGVIPKDPDSKPL